MAPLLKPVSKKLVDWLRKARTRSAKRRQRQAEAQSKRFAWAVLRVQVHQRENGRCLRCKRKVYLSTRNPFDLMHAHHLKYRSQGGADSVDNLVALCGECHDLLHRHVVELPETIQ